MDKMQIIFYIKCNYNTFGIAYFDIYNNNFPNYSKRNIHNSFLYDEMHFIKNIFAQNKIEVIFKIV